ncbi:hypothetical protein AVEN_117558-1 [Araneus ventricosus]|uniref:Uncharacterized protein n=1 Tax=Araneus ventricosus TaxID=182803 RepID=A0A4Y2TDZ5_ARAVE|nr:hypothetical protein AVEN_117558-1 [Araneus ventricosus]
MRLKACVFTPYKSQRLKFAETVPSGILRSLGAFFLSKQNQSSVSLVNHYLTDSMPVAKGFAPLTIFKVQTKFYIYKRRYLGHPAPSLKNDITNAPVLFCLKHSLIDICAETNKVTLGWSWTGKRGPPSTSGPKAPFLFLSSPEILGNN